MVTSANIFTQENCKVSIKIKIQVLAQYSQGKPSYAQMVSKALPQQVHSIEQSPFLGQSHQTQPQIIGQASQQPFLGQSHQNQQVFLDLQNGQKQMIDLFMSMNQKLLSNLEKLNKQI